MIPPTMTPTRRDRFLGCLLGGAVGDALGAPVEFMRRERDRRPVRDRAGSRHYAPAYGVTGAITDDTQMTLFTAEGLLRAAGCARRSRGSATRRASWRTPTCAG